MLMSGKVCLMQLTKQCKGHSFSSCVFVECSMTVFFGEQRTVKCISGIPQKVYVFSCIIKVIIMTLSIHLCMYRLNIFYYLMTI